MSNRSANGKITLADVAAAAGVSKVTASKVLSGDTAKNTRVSGETEARILKIAAEMGYRRNVTARILAGKGSRNIGVILDTNSPPAHFYRVSTIEKAASARGFRIMVGQCHPNIENIRDYTEDFVSRGIDMLVSMAHIYPHIGKDVVKLFNDNGLRTVYYDIPPGMEGLPGVNIDFAGAARKATRYLYGKGRRRIMQFLPKQELQFGRFHYITRREEGYKTAIRELGLEDLSYPLDYRNALHEESNEGIMAMLDEAIKTLRPDAIAAQSDSVAAVVLRYCHLNKIRVPEDIAVIGFNNMDFSAFTYPALTTIDPEASKAAEKLVDMLCSDSELYSFTLETEIIEREST